jgi:hypothetical protein
LHLSRQHDQSHGEDGGAFSVLRQQIVGGCDDLKGVALNTAHALDQKAAVDRPRMIRCRGG